MKRLMFFLVAGMLLVGFQGKAAALSFVLDSYHVALNEHDPGLRLYWNPILTTPALLDLQEGQTSDPFALFLIGTDETVVNWDDMWPSDIHVSFGFSSPEISDGIRGWTRGRWLFSDGVVRWDGPTDFYFGQTGHFRIELMDATFDLPGATDVMATISYVQADSAALPIPEPSGILLLGCGILLLGALGRRRLLAR